MSSAAKAFTNSTKKGKTSTTTASNNLINGNGFGSIHKAVNNVGAGTPTGI